MTKIEVTTTTLSETNAERVEREAGMIIARLRQGAPAEQIGVAHKLDIARALAACDVEANGHPVGVFKLIRIFEPEPRTADDDNPTRQPV